MENTVKNKKEKKEAIPKLLSRKRSYHSEKSKSKDKYFSKYNSHSKTKNNEEKKEKNKKYIILIKKRKKFSRSRSRSKSRQKIYKKDKKYDDKKYKGEISIDSKKEKLTEKVRNDKIDEKKNKIIPSNEKIKEDMKAIQSNDSNQNNIDKENKIDYNLIDKEKFHKTSNTLNEIKLISVNFIEDNDRYMEEFIELKKSSILEKEKISLPLIKPKINIDKNYSSNELNSGNDFQKKFQLRGLVHEKEEFSSNLFKKPNKFLPERAPYQRWNNFSNNTQHNDNRSFNKFDNRNFNKRHTFNGRIKGRSWRFNN